MTMSDAIRQAAVVLCQRGFREGTVDSHAVGVTECSAAHQGIEADPDRAGQDCREGCLGLGSCARACPFGAIGMTSDGLAVVDREKCTGCEACVPVCPRGTIRMTPRDAMVHVLCNSHDRGAVVRMYCQIGCVACQMCVKTVPEAYLVENLLARVIYEHGADAARAVPNCPTGCLRNFADGCPKGSTFPAPTAVKTRAA